MKNVDVVMHHGGKAAKVTVREMGMSKVIEADLSTAAGVVRLGLSQLEFYRDTRLESGCQVSKDLLDDIDAYQIILLGGEEVAKKYVKYKNKAYHKGEKSSPSIFVSTQMAM